MNDDRKFAAVDKDVEDVEDFVDSLLYTVSYYLDGNDKGEIKAITADKAMDWITGHLSLYLDEEDEKAIYALEVGDDSVYGDDYWVVSREARKYVVSWGI